MKRLVKPVAELEVISKDFIKDPYSYNMAHRGTIMKVTDDFLDAFARTVKLTNTTSGYLYYLHQLVDAADWKYVKKYLSSKYPYYIYELDREYKSTAVPLLNELADDIKAAASEIGCRCKCAVSVDHVRVRDFDPSMYAELVDAVKQLPLAEYVEEGYWHQKGFDVYVRKM